MVRYIPLLATAACFTFLAPIGRTAEHVVEKEGL